MSTHNHKKSDREVQTDVLEELAWDTRVAPTHIGVEVQGGVVTLTGTVPSWAKKLAAEEAAHRVSAVLDVANDIHVKVLADEPTDTEIATAVRNALKWDVFVPDAQIQSTVINGAVTLKGCVETFAQREDAERAVKNLAGVRILFNEIAVETADVTPETLRESIREALDRHTDREMSKLRIDIEGGHVTLHGDVQSWREREAVIGVVTGTRGVNGVVDRLRIA
jgi:osmotically-inducible protein OsmY